jgi:cation diffusion facilitator family transporter
VPDGGGEGLSGTVTTSEKSQAQHLASGLTATWIGALTNVLLVVLKLSVGIVGRSQALIADGVHSISDLFSDMAVYFGLKWGRKAADEAHPYGHGRIETLSGLVVGLILFLVALGIAYNAVVSIYRHETEAPSVLVIFVAGFSIVIKEVLYWYTLAVGRRIDSPALIANAWHHRSDALSSVAVLIGVGVAYLNPEWHVADSVAALVVSYFIVRVSVSLLSTAANELVDTTPGPDVMDGIRQRASAITGVREVHDIRARKSGPHILVELHIVVDKDITVLEGHGIAKQVEGALLHELPKVSKVTIHIDPDTVRDRRL